MTSFPATVTPAEILLALAGGLAVGVAYYGGLWWTVQRVGMVERPGLLFVVSFLVRTSIALAGLILLTALRWQLILAFMAMFVVARIVLTRRWGLDRGRGAR